MGKAKAHAGGKRTRRDQAPAEADEADVVPPLPPEAAVEAPPANEEVGESAPPPPAAAADADDGGVGEAVDAEVAALPPLLPSKSWKDFVPADEITAALSQARLAPPFLETRWGWSAALLDSSVRFSDYLVMDDHYLDKSKVGCASTLQGILAVNKLRFEPLNRTDKVDEKGIEVKGGRVKCIEKSDMVFLVVKGADGEDCVVFGCVFKILVHIHAASVHNIYAIVINAKTGTFLAVHHVNRTRDL